MGRTTVYLSALCVCLTAPALTVTEQVALRIEDADVVLGAVFPIHLKVTGTSGDDSMGDLPSQRRCTGLYMRYLTWMYTMLYAIDEINERQDLLPDIRLGYDIYDSCTNVMKSLEAGVALMKATEDLTRPPLVGVIGDGNSKQTVVLAQMLGLHDVPLISYAASAPALGNKAEFPTFMRTIPGDSSQSKALAELVGHFRWTWIGTLGSDDEYGRQGLSHFENEVASMYKVCFSFRLWIPKNAQYNDITKIVDTIADSNAMSIVVFAIDTDFEPVLKEVVRRNIVDRIWVASEGWITSPYLNKPEYAPTLEGTIGFDVAQGNVQDIMDYLRNPMRVAENPFGDEPMNRMENYFLNEAGMGIPFAVYLAVYTVAHALHDLLDCDTKRGADEKSSCASVSNIQPWQMLMKMHDLNFQLNNYSVKFFKNGDPLPHYVLKNWQRQKDGTLVIKNVGTYEYSKEGTNTSALHFTSEPMWKNSSSTLDRWAPHTGLISAEVTKSSYQSSSYQNAINCTDCTPNEMSSENHTSCVPKPLEYLRWGSGEGITLVVLAMLGFCFTLAVTVIFVRYHDTPIVKASNRTLYFTLLFSLGCMFLGTLTFFGEPTPWQCFVQQPCFGISFSLCLSCTLVKAVEMVVAFKPSEAFTNKLKIIMKFEVVIVALLTSIEVVICVLWLAILQPQVTMQPSLKSINVECQKSSLFLIPILSYIYLLGLVCVVLAFLVRKVPKNFNEGKLVLLGMLTFFIVWISFIPAYYVTPGKYMVAVEVISIILSGYGIIGFLFFRKCYIILWKPQNNTRWRVNNDQLCQRERDN
ncbi:extracellular calcium-sensing receptor-like [Lampetra planeri]